MNDSAATWLAIRKNLREFVVLLGRATAQGYVNDPRMIAFIAARYKFVAKMLAGKEMVLEVGCGDAFGAPIVAQAVHNIICTDIDPETLARNRDLCHHHNINFIEHDFTQHKWGAPLKVDAVYAIDVIEHIHGHESPAFFRNVLRLINPHGMMIVGTPNKTAEQYASAHSRAGHVNLYNHNTLKLTMEQYFHNALMFGMNDEVVHTGYGPMCHYLWAIGIGPR